MYGQIIRRKIIIGNITFGVCRTCKYVTHFLNSLTSLRSIYYRKMFPMVHSCILHVQFLNFLTNLVCFFFLFVYYWLFKLHLFHLLFLLRFYYLTVVDNWYKLLTISIMCLVKTAACSNHASFGIFVLFTV